MADNRVTTGADNRVTTSGDQRVLVGGVVGEVTETFPAFTEDIEATSDSFCNPVGGDNAYQCTVLSHCPVFYWPMEDGAVSNVADISGNGHHGTAPGNTPDGSQGGLVNYTGNLGRRWPGGNAPLRGPTSLNGLGPYSAFTWVWWYRKDDGLWPPFNDVMFDAGGTKSWWRNLNSSWESNFPGVSLTYHENNFTHSVNYLLAMTYEGGAAKAYVDGVQVASGTGSGNFTFPNDASPPIRMGISRTTTDNPILDSKMDEMAFIPHALTASEIQALYNCGTTTDHADCVSCLGGIFVDMIAVTPVGIGVG